MVLMIESGVKSMSYKELWKTIANPLTDLRNLGEVIPPEVMMDLHSAKTLINILSADPSHIEFLEKIEAYLQNVESYIVYAAQNKIGIEYIETFMEKLKKAREELYKKEVEVAPTYSRFIPELPRGKPWIRIKATNELSKGQIESLAEEHKLSFEMQEDNYLLVYGDKEKIKDFIKKIAENLNPKDRQSQDESQPLI